MLDEYKAWVQIRGMKVEQANKVLSFMLNMEGYDVEHYKGLCQLCWQIQKKNNLNTTLNMMTYALLKYLGEYGDVERCDQAVLSFILQKYFPNAKIMWVDNTIYDGKYFTWYAHNSDTPLIIPPKPMLASPYWNIKPLIDEDCYEYVFGKLNTLTITMKKLVRILLIKWRYIISNYRTI